MSEAQLIAARCIQVVSEACADTPVHLIPTEHQLARDLGLDSLERFELLLSLEDEFRIEFNPADEERLGAPTTTVLDLILAVERHLSEKETTT